MSLPRFFLNEQVLADEGESVFGLRLSPDDARHFKVLRLSPGERIAVVDAACDYFVCEVVDSSDAVPLVSISSRGEMRAPEFSVTLFQGIPKGDKMDKIVRHATEVGVDAFVPVAFSRCVSKLDADKGAKKRARWQAIAKSAAMQAGRMAIPSIADPVNTSDACGMIASYDKAVVFWEETETSETLGAVLKDVRHQVGAKTQTEGLRTASSIAVVVGPEGGLTSGEVAALLACGNASEVSLGSNILRTETAGVVGCALVIYELGGLGNSRQA